MSRTTWVELIERENGNSFSNNNNMAFQATSSEYFLMLNSDTILDDGAIDTLVQFMDENRSCGICAAKLVFPDGSLQLPCRRFPTLWSTLLRRTPFRALLPSKQRGVRHLMASVPHTSNMAVDWMLGTCLLVRRQTISGEELLDEEFPLCGEEIDLCLRLKQGGWTSFYIPGAKVVHPHQAKSDASLFSRASLLHFRSMTHFAKSIICLEREVPAACSASIGSHRLRHPHD